MKSILMLTALTAGVLVAGCGPGKGKETCQILVLEDTTQVYVSGDRVMAMTKNDTLPKPYAMCVTVYATRDTLPKPR